MGLDAAGLPSFGNIQAQSPTVAKVLLHQQGITAQKIKKIQRTWSERFNRNINPEDITLFSRQMATLLNAQIPLIQAFNTLKNGQKNPKIQALLDTIKQDVQTGITFADALRKHPHFFNPLFCNLVDAGEQSGALALLLMKLARYQEHVAAIRKKIRATLTYPLAILFLALCVTLGLLLFVVPQFESLFNSFGAELPPFTRVVIRLSNGLKTYWVLGGVLTMTSVYAFRYALCHSTGVAFAMDRFLLALPWLGHVLEHAVIARLTHTLSITLTAGLPLIDALKAAAGVAGNRVYTQAMVSIRENVTHGLALQSAMEQSRRFPSMVIQMVAIGEESGKLEPMLAHIATQYDEALNDATHALSRLAEPLLMAVLGIIVGALIVAMYLPIFQLGAIV